MAHNGWVKKDRSSNKLKCLFQVRISVNKIKEYLDKHQNLSNTRVQLLFEKSIFGNTERCEEIERKIGEISGQLEKLASKVKTGGELLIELELENSK
jgi:hypothetical protein